MAVNIISNCGASNGRLNYLKVRLAHLAGCAAVMRRVLFSVRFCECDSVQELESHGVTIHHLGRCLKNAVCCSRCTCTSNEAGTHTPYGRRADTHQCNTPLQEFPQAPAAVNTWFHQKIWTVSQYKFTFAFENSNTYGACLTAPRCLFCSFHTSLSLSPCVCLCVCVCVCVCVCSFARACV